MLHTYFELWYVGSDGVLVTCDYHECRRHTAVQQRIIRDGRSISDAGSLISITAIVKQYDSVSWVHIGLWL